MTKGTPSSAVSTCNVSLGPMESATQTEMIITIMIVNIVIAITLIVVVFIIMDAVCQGGRPVLIGLLECGLMLKSAFACYRGHKPCQRGLAGLAVGG